MVGNYSRRKAAGNKRRSYRRPRRSSFGTNQRRGTPRYDFSRYVERNDALKQLGFESYDEYLKSELWQSIRSRVLVRDKFICHGCAGRAFQVHHRNYAIEVLNGKRLNEADAVAICDECHKHCEIDPASGRKFPIHTANKRLKKLHNKHRSLFRPKPSNTRRFRARAEELGVVISCTFIGEMQVPPGFRLD